MGADFSYLFLFYLQYCGKVCGASHRKSKKPSKQRTFRPSPFRLQNRESGGRILLPLPQEKPPRKRRLFLWYERLKPLVSTTRGACWGSRLRPPPGADEGSRLAADVLQKIKRATRTRRFFGEAQRGVYEDFGFAEVNKRGIPLSWYCHPKKMMSAEFPPP